MPEWVDGEARAADDKSCSDWDEEDREGRKQDSSQDDTCMQENKLRESRNWYFQKRKRVWTVNGRDRLEGHALFIRCILEVAGRSSEGGECRRMKREGKIILHVL